MAAASGLAASDTDFDAAGASSRARCAVSSGGAVDTDDAPTVAVAAAADEAKEDKEYYMLITERKKKQSKPFPQRELDSSTCHGWFGYFSAHPFSLTRLCPLPIPPLAFLAQLAAVLFGIRAQYSVLPGISAPGVEGNSACKAQAMSSYFKITGLMLMDDRLWRNSGLSLT